MSRDPEAERALVDRLARRMLGGLLLGGAATLLALALVLWCLPRVHGAGGGFLLLPGTQGRHRIGATAIPILAIGGLLLGAPGLLAFTRLRGPASFGTTPPAEPSSRAFRRPALVLLAGGAVLVAVLLRR